MKIKEGDKLPSAELFYLDENNAAKRIATNSLSKDQQIIIFGVPGAFTKICSARHLPGYVKNFDDIKKKAYLKLFVFQ